MNFQQIKTLLAINLRYANTRYTARQRRRGKTGVQLTRGLLLQYGLSGLIFLLIFTARMIPLDFPHYPGLFGFYLAMYSLFAASQAFGSLHNVLYESKDLKDFLPLPLTNASIFFAKFLTVALTVFPFALPLLSLFLITGLRALGFVGILLAVLAFVLVTSIILSLSLLVISFLAQTKLFQRFKKITNTILMILPIVGTLGVYLYLVALDSPSSSEIMASGKIPDRAVLPVFMPAFDALTKPLSVNSLIFWLLSLVLLVLFALLLKRNIIPRMFELQLAERPTESRRQKKSQRSSAASQSVSRQLFNYNLGLIKNPGLWQQMLISGYLMPLAFSFGMTASGAINLSKVSPIFFASFVLGGVFFAYLTLNPASLVSLIISLDRENHLYIKSLPMSFATYLRIKFHFAIGLQILMNSVVLLAMTFILKIPLVLFLALLLGNVLASYVYGQFYYSRDLRLLNLNWTNVSELYARGGGNWLSVGLLFLVLIGGGVIITLAAFIQFAARAYPLVSNLVLILLTGLVFWFINFYYQKTFWKAQKVK